MEGMGVRLPALAHAEMDPGVHLRPDVAMSDTTPDREEQIADLFLEYYDGLCRLAALLLSDRGGAEDVVQEAFLRTFSSWWRIRHLERAHWYLRTAVINQCRSRLRRRSTEDRSNRTIYATDPERQAAGQIVTDGTHGSDDSLVVMNAISGLPPRQRETVILRYYEDLPEAEIAKVLGCSVGTVKSQLAKARSSLSVALGSMSLERDES
jgi:RNA polymerase sigma-70 factor (sigma-E family)